MSEYKCVFILRTGVIVYLVNIAQIMRVMGSQCCCVKNAVEGVVVKTIPFKKTEGIKHPVVVRVEARR